MCVCIYIYIHTYIHRYIYIELEHGFRRIGARIPYTLPQGRKDTNVPTFRLLLYMGGCQNYGPFLGPYYNTAPII